MDKETEKKQSVSWWSPVVFGLVAGLLSGGGCQLLDMSSDWVVPVMFGGCVGFGAAMTVAFGVVWKHEKEQWEEIHVGLYEHVEYVTRGKYGVSTVIRFEDGQTRIFDGRYDVAHPRGARIRIMKNGVGEYCILAADEEVSLAEAS